MYLTRTPELLRRLLPGYTWTRPTAGRVLYLTFDDGPIPGVTPWVLATLAEYGARATFFCVGDNVRKHPDVLRAVRAGGHAVGNHTYHHLDGWTTPTQRYLRDVERCAAVLPTKLFRPPYGRLRPGQARRLRAAYRLVMWDVLSGDFDEALSGEACLRNVTTAAGPGSIVVFHDSRKAAARLRYALPRVLRHFDALGYRFDALPDP